MKNVFINNIKPNRPKIHRDQAEPATRKPKKRPQVGELIEPDLTENNRKGRRCEPHDLAIATEANTR